MDQQQNMQKMEPPDTIELLDEETRQDADLLFPASFSQTPSYAHWCDIGIKHQLQSHLEIVCFLMKCYDDTYGNSACMNCGSPLTFACVKCTTHANPIMPSTYSQHAWSRADDASQVKNERSQAAFSAQSHALPPSTSGYLQHDSGVAPHYASAYPHHNNVMAQLSPLAEVSSVVAQSQTLSHVLPQTQNMNMSQNMAQTMPQNTMPHGSSMPQALPHALPMPQNQTMPHSQAIPIALAMPTTMPNASPMPRTMPQDSSMPNASPMPRTMPQDSSMPNASAMPHASMDQTMPHNVTVPQVTFQQTSTSHGMHVNAHHLQESTSFTSNPPSISSHIPPLTSSHIPLPSSSSILPLPTSSSSFHHTSSYLPTPSQETSNYLPQPLPNANNPTALANSFNKNTSITASSNTHLPTTVNNFSSAQPPTINNFSSSSLNAHSDNAFSNNHTNFMISQTTMAAPKTRSVEVQTESDNKKTIAVKKGGFKKGLKRKPAEAKPKMNEKTKTNEKTKPSKVTKMNLRTVVGGRKKTRPTRACKQKKNNSSSSASASSVSSSSVSKKFAPVEIKTELSTSDDDDDDYDDFDEGGETDDYYSDQGADLVIDDDDDGDLPEKKKRRRRSKLEMEAENENLSPAERQEKEERERALKSLYCAQCDKKYSCRLTLKRHLELSKAHGGPGNVIIPKNRKVEQGHKRPKRSLEEYFDHWYNKNEVDVIDDTVVCKLCVHSSKTFTSKGDWRKHHREHKIRVKKTLCPVCGHEVDNLKIHMLYHKSDKPHKCPYCPAAYVIKQKLRDHIYTHTKEKNFCCEICGKRFSVKARLAAHSLVHSNQKPYKCDQCGDSFARNRGLKDHMRVHTGEKPYCCGVCGRKFASSGNLAAHRRKVHRMAPMVGRTAKKLIVVD